MNQPTKKIAVVMGSTSDWPVMKAATELLDEWQIPYHKQVLSAHRAPQEMLDFAKNSAAQGFEVIIAGAGGAAHLPGMLASNCVLPVIGVPIEIGPLRGQDALYSIVQMPKGVPVASVGIGNAVNAALLALRILSINDSEIRSKLNDFQVKNKETSINSSVGLR